MRSPFERPDTAAPQERRATARSWRDHADILRFSAQASHLNPAQRQQLAGEAGAADLQEDRWLDAAEEE